MNSEFSVCFYICYEYKKYFALPTRRMHILASSPNDVYILLR